MYFQIYLSNINIIAFSRLIPGPKYAQIIIFIAWFYCHRMRYSGCTNDCRTLSYKDCLIWIRRAYVKSRYIFFKFFDQKISN